MVEMIALRSFAHGGGVVRRGEPLQATKWEAENYVRGPAPLARLADEASVSPAPETQPETQKEPKAPAAKPARKRNR